MQDLLEAQNADGGWGIRTGEKSWTETTAWAVLAQQHQLKTPGMDRALAWLDRARTRAGGWHAAPGIDSPSWVTALICLIPPALIGEDAYQSGLSVVRSSMTALPTWQDRLRNWMLGLPPDRGPVSRGWSWVPGTAGWLVPTAISILALKKSAQPADSLLLEHATNYLFARQCNDGGWNHGSSRALGYDSPAYPETTGLALVALRGVKNDRVSRALDIAQRLARHCQTFEGACWLRLALHTHGLPAVFEPPARYRPDNRERAIEIIVERSIAGEALLWRA